MNLNQIHSNLIDPQVIGQFCSFILERSGPIHMTRQEIMDVITVPKDMGYTLSFTTCSDTDDTIIRATKRKKLM